MEKADELSGRIAKIDKLLVERQHVHAPNAVSTQSLIHCQACDQ